MEKAEQNTPQPAAPKIGKVFLVFAGLCAVALPLVVMAAFSYEKPEPALSVVQAPSPNFDHNGKAVFENYDRIVKEYLEGISTERTLDEYYARRQYPGSPPFIPHKVEDSEGAEMACEFHRRGPRFTSTVDHVIVATARVIVFPVDGDVIGFFQRQP